MDEFEELIEEAQRQSIVGWDFSYLHGRSTEEEVTWNYREIVQEAKAKVGALLDMGTGGGEFLSSLAPLPRDTCVTEAYGPNVSVAKRRLKPFGVSVAHIESDNDLPFEADRFELIINRHESHAPAEVHRILRGEARLSRSRSVGAMTIASTNFCRRLSIRLLLTGTWTSRQRNCDRRIFRSLMHARNILPRGFMMSGQWSIICAWWSGRFQVSRSSAMKGNCVNCITLSQRMDALRCSVIDS